MVGCGLPQWVAMVIGGEGESHQPSDYVLRYVLALLMNLSLRSSGRGACLEAGPLLLRSLGELLEHEDEEVRVQTFLGIMVSTVPSYKHNNIKTIAQFRQFRWASLALWVLVILAIR